MIPTTGWSIDDNKTPYATYNLVKPNYKSTFPNFVSLGPPALNISDSTLKEAYWVFEEFEGTIRIAKFIGTSKQEWIELFSSGPVNKLSGTFDQLGKPLVFYDLGGILYFWWFDPVLAAHTITEMVTGSSPFAAFDIRHDTSNPTSDAILFYVRDGGIYYRYQRDRYEVEYATPVPSGVTEIVAADMAVDYHLQLEYLIGEVGFEPPVVVPPEPPEVPTTPNHYRLQGNTSGVSLANNLWTVGTDLTVTMDFVEVDKTATEVVLFSQALSETVGTYGASLILSTYGSNPEAAVKDKYRVIYGGVETIISEATGFEIQGNTTMVFSLHTVGADTFLTITNSIGAQLEAIINTGSNNEPAATFLIGSNRQGGALPPSRSYKGVISSVVVETGGLTRKLLLKDKADMIETTDTLPLYDENDQMVTAAKIFAYLPNNWVYIAPKS